MWRKKTLLTQWHNLVYVIILKLHNSAKLVQTTVRRYLASVVVRIMRIQNTVTNICAPYKSWCNADFYFKSVMKNNPQSSQVVDESFEALQNRRLISESDFCGSDTGWMLLEDDIYTVNSDGYLENNASIYEETASTITSGMARSAYAVELLHLLRITQMNDIVQYDNTEVDEISVEEKMINTTTINIKSDMKTQKKVINGGKSNLNNQEGERRSTVLTNELFRSGNTVPPGCLMPVLTNINNRYS